jgi:hypothetical protein
MDANVFLHIGKNRHAVGRISDRTGQIQFQYESMHPNTLFSLEILD